MHPKCLLQPVQHGGARTSIHCLIKQVGLQAGQLRQVGSDQAENSAMSVHSIFARHVALEHSRDVGFKPVHIQLDSFDLPHGIAPPSQQRVQAVTICYSSGSTAPTTHGVKLDWTATHGQVKKVLKQQSKVASDQDIRLVILHRNLFFRYTNGWRYAVAQHMSMLWFLQTDKQPCCESFMVSSGLSHDKHCALQQDE